MKKLQFKIFLLAAILILFSLLGFVLNQIIAVSRLLHGINPLLGTVTLWFLLCMAALCAFYLAGAYLLRQKPLVLPSNPTLEQERLYLDALAKRLNANEELAKGGMRVTGAADIAGCAAYLESLADEEIKRVAKRVFVSTSIAQNGRLDSIIVFYQIAVLIWKISRIYGQRPYPDELWKIYCNVLATSMISYGIEQVDLTDQIGSLLSPLVANSVLDHVPVVKTFTKVFTHAILSGSANAGLVCRVGVVAKNYMGLKTLAGHSVKVRPTLEAARILNSISSESVQKVLSALAGSLKGIAVQGARKATVSLADSAGAAAQGVADAGKTIGENTRDGVMRAGAYALKTAQSVGESVVEISTTGAKKAAKTVLTVADVAGKSIAETGRSAGALSQEVYSSARSTVKKIAAGAAEVTQEGLGTIKKTASKASSILPWKNR
ncbi:MAG: hypothetical protein LLG06_00620 [Desulfobacteraceae bacterium]|nr:hypothetical protein [Desulfobacteraceae bacterium]